VIPEFVDISARGRPILDLRLDLAIRFFRSGKKILGGFS
jgi:hypothetical protein